MNRALATWNGEAVPTADVPLVGVQRFQDVLGATLAGGGRVTALFARHADDGGVVVTAVLADDRESRLGLVATRAGARWPSMAAEWPALQLFERELWEEYGVEPEGHPWLKRVRFEAPHAAGHPIAGHLAGPALPDAPRPDPAPRGPATYRPEAGRARPEAVASPADIPGDYPFFRVEGEEVHEVAVGPVHAGIIEPGHFRFGCHGEHVFHLEIVLGYQHRGAEALLQRAPAARALRVAESIAGDTAVGHALAHCRAVEALAGVEAPPRASFLRGVALELERLANHVGDLGMLAGDVGFLPTASACGALRAEFLNASAELCGNRFGMGLVVPGGVRFDLAPEEAERLADKVERAMRHVRAAAKLFFDSPSTRNRTDGTGTVSRDLARALGLVGPAARASGLRRDVRQDHPFGLYRFAHVPVVVGETGDVYARAWVRSQECDRSAGFVAAQLRNLPDGPVRAAVPPPAPGRTAVSMVEGWRGEITHVAVTGGDGRLARYKVKDPSFHNWMGLALALRGQAISDFPLCNKSFNLSYAGHDL